MATRRRRNPIPPVSADGVPMPIELMRKLEDVITGRRRDEVVMALTTILAAVLTQCPSEYRLNVVSNLMNTGGDQSESKH